jgi:acyl-CoA synthetase (AMP-forming)/AMP-acid ligase II
LVRAHPDTIPGLLQEVQGRRGPALALDDGLEALSYTEVLAVARDAAAGVAKIARTGDRVAIWAPNSSQWALAALAALFAGASVVPVNTRYTGPEMEDIVSRAGCRLIFAEHGFLGREMARVATSLLPGVAVIGLGPGAADSVTSWSELAGSPGSGAEVDSRLAALTPDAISHVQFTSGTTGRPKGAMLRHGAMVRTTAEWVRTVGLRPDDRYPVIAPFSHIGGHKTGLLACVTAGAVALPFATLDIDRLVGQMTDGVVTFMQGPPTMFQDLIGRFRPPGADPGHLRVAVTGGAVVAPSLVRDISSVLGVDDVFTSYGLTESTGVCTITSSGDPAEIVAETSGRAIPGVEVGVVDPHGLPMPAAAVGEIVVRGYSLMAGYLDDPDATSEAIRNGWLHTGDVGWIGEEGCLRIVDRLKDMIIVGGLNAYPAEIERVLLECESVQQVAVVGAQDERLGEVPVAFVVPAPGSAIAPAALEEFCRERLANFKRPRAYLFVEHLPLTASGKVAKTELRLDAPALGAPPVP